MTVIYRRVPRGRTCGVSGGLQELLGHQPFRCGTHASDLRNRLPCSAPNGAHLGEPKNIQEATYRDLFTFGAETAKAMEPLALATGIAIKPINTDPDSESSPEAFWAPWKDT